MLNICITFDYELFFGENRGTYEEILFKPTRDLAEMLYKESVTATFFADICSIIQSEKYGQQEYVRGFTQQMQELCVKNQDIQLHIHSHWLVSEYRNGAWAFDEKSYRLHSYGFDRDASNNAFEIIKEGIRCLKNIIQEVDPQYECIAYRAGGFAIQPHEELVKALYDAGIRIDSSIAPQLMATSDTNYYQYKHKMKYSNWWLAPETEWWRDKGDSQGALYEIPIATENKNPVTFIFKRIFTPERIKLQLTAKRGTYINEGGRAQNRMVAYWNYIKGYSALSLDAYNADFLYKQLVRYYKKNGCNEKDATIAVIGHPKLITEEYIANLRNLIRLIREDERFCICSVRDVYDKKILEKI